MEKENEVFSTRDIYLAATLITLGFGVTNINYQHEGTREQPVGYFEFEKSDELIAVEQKYWKGDLAVEPRAFVTAMRGLKARVSNSFKNPRLNN